MVNNNPEPDYSWFAALQQKAQDYELALEQLKEWLWEQSLDDIEAILSRCRARGVWSPEDRRASEELRGRLNNDIEKATRLIMRAGGPIDE